MIRQSTIAGFIGALAVSAVAAGWTAPDFPRVGGIQIGSPFNYDNPAYAAQLARQNIMILGDYPGMAPDGMQMQQAVTNIKAHNPNALVFTYVNGNNVAENTQTPTSTTWAAYVGEINHMKWWLYSDTASSKQVPAGFGDQNDWQVNVTLYTPKDSNGDPAILWLARFFAANYTLAATDGLFTDNLGWRPYVNGQWKAGSGVVDLDATPTVQSWFRQGYASYVALLRSLMPGKFQIGNIGDWGTPGATLTEYQGMLNGGVLESYIGQSWSIETTAGWASTLAEYRQVMANVVAPKLIFFNQWGSSTDYQSMRYGLGTCLLDDGYYSFTNTTQGYYGVVWFDELSQPLGPSLNKPTAAWQKGVWRRDFANGIMLVNPKGNGAQTVTLESPYIKVKGTQDPLTNSGAIVTTVTLKDRDGLMLLRKSATVTPMQPTGVRVQH